MAGRDLWGSLALFPTQDRARAFMLEQAAQSPVLLDAVCLQGWGYPTSPPQCLATIEKMVPELILQFRLEDSGPSQFKLFFHLN